MVRNVTFALLAQVWSAVPEGRTGGEVEFTRIHDVSVQGGMFYLLDPILRQVFIYGLAGNQIATFGRRGDGPGEFSQPPIRLGWAADTLWVLDPPNRIHYFSPAGKPLRTNSVQPSALGPTRAGGVLIAEYLTTPGGPVGDGIIRKMSLRHQAANGHTRVVAALDFFVAPLRVKATINGNPGTTYRDEPMRDDPLFAMDRNGQFVWVVLRRTSDHAPHQFRLIKLTVTGDTVFSRSFPYRPRPLDQEALEYRLSNVERAILRQSPAYNTVVRRDELARELYRPHHLPPIEQLLPGADGKLWLRRESRPGGKADYIMLSARGEELGMLQLPLEEYLIEADGERVWTVREDEDGVPSVAWYRVKRR